MQATTVHPPPSNPMNTSPQNPWTVRADLLGGIEVVELSSGVAGAYCGMVLAQLGAHVSRVPSPTAIIASPQAKEVMQQVLHGEKTPIEPGALDAALARAHILILDSYPDAHPQALRMRALAHGRAGLRADAVVVVLSSDGAREDEAGTGSALTSTADSGMSFSIGSRGLAPLTLPYDITDYQCGINGVAAALAGLLGHMGPAGAIDVASRDVLANLVGTLAQNYVPFGRPWRREGTRPSMSGGVYPCGLFPCKDGYVAVYCRGTSEWHGMLRAMGSPPWSQEERFLDPKVVATLHADEADSHMMPWLAGFTRAQLMELGSKFGFPVAPVRYVREALDDAHFAFRGSFRPHERAGKPPLKVPAPPWRFQSPDQLAQVKLPRWAHAAHTQAAPSQLLKGLRVLDFTWVWSGPMVTSLLADLGAEVIKVEHPSRPDSLRLRARPLRNGVPFEGPPSGELNPWFNQLNHGKKSVIADLKSPECRERLLHLARSCDVVVENMRPGALAASGLGYHDLAARNPGLVMLSMSMAGQIGPLAQMKGYAGIMTSMAGMESVTGYESSLPDAPFTGMTMTAFGDPNGAAHGMAALLAALYRRVATGRGTWIDLAQTDAILAVMGAPIVDSQLLGHVPVRGNTHPDLFPHGHFPALGNDCWLALSVRTDAQWHSLVQAVGSALAPFAAMDLAARQAHRAQIDQIIGHWTRARGAAQTAALLRAQGIACAPVATYEQMLDSHWKKQRALTRMVDHPYLGKLEVFVPPWRFGEQSAGVSLPAPLLEQHTDEILGSHADAPVQGGAALAK